MILQSNILYYTEDTTHEEENIFRLWVTGEELKNI